MKKFKLICEYCGNSWVENIYSMAYISCSICNDKNIKAKQIDENSTDVFGYNIESAKPDAYVKKS